MRLQMLAPADHPDFLDLPLAQPLEQWEHPSIIGGPGGLHRHVVRYVDYAGAVYCIKELPEPLTEREFTLLRVLAGQAIPAVSVVGMVTERGDDSRGEGLLITRHLDFSLPYRVLIGSPRPMPYLGPRLLDAMAGLLARLHLAGFFWGDCSLSNTLFRRDAGELTAYVVDVETSEVHHPLSKGQRLTDLAIATENVAGGLFDLEAAGRLPAGLDPIATAVEIEDAYRQLWAELTRTELIRTDETYRIRARVTRLNDLGFDVAQLELDQTPDGRQLRLTPRVVELGYHAPRLASLTGVAAQENQARRLLADIAELGARLDGDAGRKVPDTVVAARWLEQVYEPALAAIPADLRAKREGAELFHELLEHRWFLSEAQGSDVGMDEAVRSYVEAVLQFAPDERTVVDGTPQP